MNGFSEVEIANNAKEAMRLFTENDYSLVLLDIMMPDYSGSELLKEMIALKPDVAIIMSTAINDVDMAVECMRSGAFDYLVKPIEKKRLLASVQKALDYSDLKKENQRLTENILNSQPGKPQAFKSIITQSESIKALFRYIEAISPTSMPVLVHGETGTGKELFARSIHDASGRTGDFITVNIAGLDDTLLTDTLFGHEQGAFTGADKKRPGLIVKAEDGTLFLDEIGDLRPESQVKLLRLLEERTYYPVGSDSLHRANCRFVLATSVDLLKAVADGKFRKDLFYRLKSHIVRVPPLRDHIEDIPLLLSHFLELASSELSKPAPVVPTKIIQLLKTYSFPGNVRELRGIAFDAASRFAGEMLSVDILREHLISENVDMTINDSHNSTNLLSIGSSLPTLKEAEALLISEALTRCNNNQSQAAKLLGITPSALNKRLNLRR
jgi:DNA-binding NtrC family response regulator